MQKGHSCACSCCSNCPCFCSCSGGRVLNDHKSQRLARPDEIERLLSRVTPKHILYPPGIKNLAPGTHHMAPSDDGSVSPPTNLSPHLIVFCIKKTIERLTFFFLFSFFSIISLWFFILFLFYFFFVFFIESERCRRHPRIAASCGSQEVWQPRIKKNTKP